MLRDETTAVIDKYDDAKLYLHLDSEVESPVRAYNDATELDEESGINLEELNTRISSTTINEDEGYHSLADWDKTV